MEINYKSDFKAVIKDLAAAFGRTVPDGVDMRVQLYSVPDRLTLYHPERVVMAGDSLTITADNHCLPVGDVYANIEIDFPNEAFPDGFETLARTFDTGVSLVPWVDTPDVPVQPVAKSAPWPRMYQFSYRTIPENAQPGVAYRAMRAINEDKIPVIVLRLRTPFYSCIDAGRPVYYGNLLKGLEPYKFKESDRIHIDEKTQTVQSLHFGQGYAEVYISDIKDIKANEIFVAVGEDGALHFVPSNLVYVPMPHDPLFPDYIYSYSLSNFHMVRTQIQRKKYVYIRESKKHWLASSDPGSRKIYKCHSIWTNYSDNVLTDNIHMFRIRSYIGRRYTKWVYYVRKDTGIYKRLD